MASFDITQASVNGSPAIIAKKNGRPQHHEIDKGIIDLGESGLDLAIKLPEGLPAGEYDLVLRLRIG
jgi:hypothetical protein